MDPTISRKMRGFFLPLLYFLLLSADIYFNEIGVTGLVLMQSAPSYANRDSHLAADLRPFLNRRTPAVYSPSEQCSRLYGGSWTACQVEVVVECIRKYPWPSDILCGGWRAGFKWNQLMFTFHFHKATAHTHMHQHQHSCVINPAVSYWALQSAC